MDSTPKHGLAGKARRVRDVTRSHRMHSQQMIEEYLDWETEEAEEPKHFIPIKRTCEFLPSAEVPGSVSSDDSGAGQFEFDHTKQEPIVDRSADSHLRKAKTAPEAGEPESLLPPAFPVSVPEKPAVIRPRRAQIDILAEATPAPNLSTKGFLVGCGVGGAAAVMLLMLARWLLG